MKAILTHFLKIIFFFLIFRFDSADFRGMFVILMIGEFRDFEIFKCFAKCFRRFRLELRLER